MAPPLPKGRDQKAPSTSQTSQNFLEPEKAEKNDDYTSVPNPKPFCTYLTYILLGTSVLIGGIAPCTYFLSNNCTKAEEIVQKLCYPELIRLHSITEAAVPDFGMSPIAMEIAKKCEDVTDCLSAIKCYRLRSISPFPPRCPIFQFFNFQFQECRQKLMFAARQINIECLKIFFGPGPILCPSLNANIDCVLNQVFDLCDTNTYYEFRGFVEEYRTIIDCLEDPETSELTEVLVEKEPEA